MPGWECRSKYASCFLKTSVCLEAVPDFIYQDIVSLWVMGFYEQGDNEFTGLGKPTATDLGPASLQ